MRFTGLYIYVDGCDLDVIAESLLDDLYNLIATKNIGARVINDKFGKTPDMEEDDYPDWNLGINLDNTNTIIQDLELIIPSLRDVALKYKRDFVLGYYDKDSRISEDIVFFGYQNRNKPVVDIVRKILDI